MSLLQPGDKGVEISSDKELAPLAQSAVVDRVESLLEPWDETSAYLRFCEDESPVLMVGAQSPMLIERIRRGGSDVVVVEPEPVRYGVSNVAGREKVGSLEIVSVPLSGYDLLRRFPRILVPRSGLFRANDRSEMVRILRSVKHHLSPFGHALVSGFVADEADAHADSVSLEQHRVALLNCTFAVEVRSELLAKARVRRRTYSVVELLSDAATTATVQIPEHFSRTDQLTYVRSEHLLPLLNSGGLRCTAVPTGQSTTWAFDCIPRAPR